MSLFESLPDLTRLELTVHDLGGGSRTLTVSFLVNVQQTLLGEFEAMCVDGALKHAHHAGHLPVGPMLVRTEPAKPTPRGPLVEGRPMAMSITDMQIENGIRSGDLVQVYCDVELGLSLT